jgi:nucleotide-binding universal stress UspA family protein
MASLLVVLVILGCVAYQYLKGTLVKSFATLIIAICASIVAFGYFEALANVFINRNILTLWAQTLSFVLLFVLTFAILQTIAAQLTRQPVDLGSLAERIGRTVCGIFIGLIISSLLLTALAMAPLPNKYPYQRFDQTNPNVEKPNKILLNADGFAPASFNIISRGSFSGKKSFAVLHPDFLDQLFLNRHNIGNKVSIITSANAIEVPNKNAARSAPEELKDSNGKPIPPKSGHTLTIVRVTITTEAIETGGTFTLSQLRLVCKQKSDTQNPLAGKGKNIYPIGYLKTPNQLQVKQINDRIELERDDFDGRAKNIDFAFYVPNDFLPVLVEFKQSCVAQVPPPVTAEQAPPPAPFIPLSECAADIAELEPISSAKIYGLELAAEDKLLASLKLKITDANQWQNAQTPQSIKPVKFKEGEINYVRAELKIERPAEEKAQETQKEAEAAESTPEKPKEKRRFKPQTTVEKATGIPGMLKPLDGYKLLSLKCSNPSTGAAIKAEQLPLLIEMSGLVHHPVGIIASGKSENYDIYEIDYCSLTAKQTADGLTIAEDGSVAKPFPDSIWLPKQVQTITEFYVLYLVKSERKAIITAVRPADSQTPAGFKEYEGFFVK